MTMSSSSSSLRRVGLLVISRGSSETCSNSNSGHSWWEKSRCQTRRPLRLAPQQQVRTNSSSHIHCSSRPSDSSSFNTTSSKTIFDTYKDPEKGTLNIGRLLLEIEKTGIRRSDPRLEKFMHGVRKKHTELGEKGTLPENISVDSTCFQKLAEESLVFLSQIFCSQLKIPQFDEFCVHIKRIFDECKMNKKGQVATYIPQLARYNPEMWACSICTVDGQRYSLGNVDTKFTLQSCSKPFTYGICMNELGPEVVHKYVGHEPSGRNFNEICLDYANKPHNPMLNSGAIMISALSLGLLMPDMSLAEKFDYMQNYLKRIAGNEDIGFNNAVFLSERDTADRNFAMAYFMKEHGAFPKQFNLQNTMDLYFQFCSLEIDTEALCVMGATLANGGICPITGEKVLDPPCVRDVLSLMYSCGMYNYSGHFAFSVGLPAKSGVSGCMILVVPNTMAIALWSPPLDLLGNSVRGLQFSHELVDLFNFHRFDNLRYSEKKLDPRLLTHEKRGLTTVTLLFAATYGDVTAIKRHHLQGVDLNESDYDGRTALHVAAAEGQLEVVHFLLQTPGIYAAPKDRWGFTPLEEAKRFGHEKVTRCLEEYLNLAKE